jgi:hemolysin D
MTGRIRGSSKESLALDFAPDIIRVQAEAPSPLPRAVLVLMLILIAAALVWMNTARLDIVAVTSGKLVPEGFLKIV